MWFPVRINQQKYKVQEISITSILFKITQLGKENKTLLNIVQFGKEKKVGKTYTPKENTSSGEITYS